MNNNTYNWGDLPQEILELIGKRLENRIDVYRFRAVCTSWRSVVPLSHHNSPQFPPLRLPPPVSATVFLSPVTVCRLEDETRTAACLVKLTQSATGKMKFINPLTPSNCVNKRDRSCKKSFNVLSLRVFEVCRGYRLKFDRMKRNGGGSVKKIVLFGKSGVLVIYDVGKLGYLGFEDENWTVLGSEGNKYEDIAVYNGQYYVVDCMGTVYWVDGKSMTLVQFSPPLFALGQVKNLVVSDGELFVVDSYFDDGTERDWRRPAIDFGIVEIRVYRLDEEWGTWVDVKSLGDRVFVLGKEVCFSVSTEDFLGFGRNCVYFADSKLEDRSVMVGFRRFFGRVFDFEDRTRMKTVDSFPFHRKLFSLPMNFPCTSETGSFFRGLDALE
ncbi:hypothetical protein RND81_07G039300 [Saponaria officinalis]|uniref:F-box domain-containing protein n=1 Tax=Saponaria officinalis TaxID=3572 RepID=A0AAW1JM45_SAPOF